MKRHIALLLCLALFLCGGVSAAGDGSQGDTYFMENGMEFRIFGGEAWVTLPKGRTGSITIPAEVRGYPVTTIKRCYADVTSVTLPDSMRVIDKYAFCGCAALQQVRGGNCLEQIRESAFEHCVNLKELTLPDSVYYIGDFAFYACSSLRHIDLGASVQSLGFFCFAYCTALEKIELPDTVVVIEDEAFSHCTALKQVRLSQQLTKLEFALFENCTALEEIELPKSVTAIDSYVFQNCKNLRRITIPDSVQSVGRNAFRGTLWLDSQPGPFVCIGSGILLKYKGTETEVRVPDGIHTIAEDAFHSHRTVCRVFLPDSVQTIEDNAFWGAGRLESVRIPPHCSYSDKAFRHTPYGYVTYGNYVYADGAIYTPDRSQLVCFPRFATTFEIPEGVRSLHEDALAYAIYLESVTLPASLETFSRFADNRHMSDFPLDRDCLKQIHVAAENPVYMDIDGVLFLREEQTLYCVPPALDTADYTVPAGTGVIDAYAFYDCWALKTITLPAAPLEAKAGAFWGGENCRFTLNAPPEATLHSGGRSSVDTVVTQSGTSAEAFAKSSACSYVLTDKENAVFTYLRDGEYDYGIYQYDNFHICTLYGEDYVSLEALSDLLRGTDYAFGFTWQTHPARITMNRNLSPVGSVPDFPQPPEMGFPVTGCRATVMNGGTGMAMDACLVNGRPFVALEPALHWLGLSTTVADYYNYYDFSLPFVPLGVDLEDYPIYWW